MNHEPAFLQTKGKVRGTRIWGTGSFKTTPIMRAVVHFALLLGIASFVSSQTSDDEVDGSGVISDDEIGHPTYTVLKTSTEVGTTARTKHGKNGEDAVIARHDAAFAAMTVVCALVGLAVRTKKSAPGRIRTCALSQWGLRPSPFVGDKSHLLRPLGH